MSLRAPSVEEREAWRARVGEDGAHDEIAARLRCLLDVDAFEPTTAEASAGPWLRVAAWNAQRGRDVAASAALLRRVDADVVLLSELDSGMARTANLDVPRELAGALGLGGAFGVEFVELGLGEPSEAAAAAAVGLDTNARGLHGNAVLTRVAGGLRDACVLRLDDGGGWFTDDRGQPRLGGRMAVAGRVALEGEDVTVASFHLESSSTADERGAQFERMLRDLDERLGTGPAVLGGDANTFGAHMAELVDRRRVAMLRGVEPTRFSWPVDHEPLFAVAAARGYSWVDANIAAPTTNHDGRGLPDHVPLKLDWLFVRGLEARRATVVPAVDPEDVALSDHDLVAVSVRLMS